MTDEEVNKVNDMLAAISAQRNQFADQNVALQANLAEAQREISRLKEELTKAKSEHELPLGDAAVAAPTDYIPAQSNGATHPH